MDDLGAVAVRAVNRHSAHAQAVAAGVRDVAGEQRLEVDPGASGGYQRAAEDLAPVHQPRLFALAPGADHDGQAVVLDVNASGEDQAAPRHAQLVVGLGPGGQRGGLGRVGLVLPRQPEGAVPECDLGAQLAGGGLVVGGQALLNQALQAAVGEAAVQLIEVEASHTVKVGRGFPAKALLFSAAHIAVFLGVVPQAAAVRAGVGGGGGLGRAVDGMLGRAVSLPGHVVPVQNVGLAAVMAGHPVAALVAGLHLLRDRADAGHGGCAADQDLAVVERLDALFGQLDRVALPLDVEVAVVGLFNAHALDGRGLDTVGRVGAEQHQEPTRELLQVLLVLSAARLQIDQRGKHGRGLDHGFELQLGVLLVGGFAREHDGHRAGVNVDDVADVVVHHAVGPADLGRLLANDFAHALVIDGLDDTAQEWGDLEREAARQCGVFGQHPVALSPLRN